MTWLEMVNKDLKELGICKVNVLDRTRCKQLICKGSVSRLLGSCSLVMNGWCQLNWYSVAKHFASFLSYIEIT